MTASSTGWSSRCTSPTSPGRATSARCDGGARRRARRHRRPRPAERRQHLRPPSLPRARRDRLVGPRARRAPGGAGPAPPGGSVHEHAVPVGSPAALDGAVRRIPDGAVVLLDGLVASPAPEVLVPHARRLRLVRLVHMALGDPREAAVLSAATAVVATSAWSRRRLLELYPLAPDRVHVAEPGVDPAGAVSGTAAGGRLLCVAAVIPGKGHDVLLAALATMT